MPSENVQKKQHKLIESCNRCPRLRHHCQNIAKAKRAAFADETYWGKPILSFGDSDPRILIVGLAPAAHGANRTGRMFTGDRSGEWLYRALHKAGFANQPESLHANDDLKLKDVLITASARCAPPDNKPTSEELKNCSEFLHWELENLKSVKVILCLGKIAFDQVWNYAKEKKLNLTNARPKFSHGLEVKLADGRILLASFHPSQQNTFTKRLTQHMFDAVFSRAKKWIQ